MCTALDDLVVDSFVEWENRWVMAYLRVASGDSLTKPQTTLALVLREPAYPSTVVDTYERNVQVHVRGYAGDLMFEDVSLMSTSSASDSEFDVEADVEFNAKFDIKIDRGFAIELDVQVNVEIHAEFIVKSMFFH